MDLDQLKLIGHLDQLKKHNILTQEEYDTARERVVNAANRPAPVVETKPPGKPQLVFGGLFILAILIGAGFLIRSCFSEPTLTEEEKRQMREDEAYERAVRKEMESIPPSPPEAPFNPDILQNSETLTIKNRNTLDYKNCEFTINDRFKAKVPLIDKGDSYFLTYDKLADEDGNIYNPKTTMIMEFEFYCKDYNGHRDLVSFEKK